MRNLYHGTTHDITEIDLSMGKGYKDFGKGFYATAVKDHAISIARRNKRVLQSRDERLRKRVSGYKGQIYTAYCYNLELDDSCFHVPDSLNIKFFKEADVEWVKFILKNRDSEISTHNFDIVIGPTADENTVTIINAYKEELEATNYADHVLRSLIAELEPENLPKQYFFGTEKAIRCLRFKKIRREIVG